MASTTRTLRESTPEEANRRENLRVLSTKYGKAQLAEKIGVAAATLSHFIGPSFSRLVREDLARDYEAKLGLAAGTLDRPVPTAQVAGRTAVVKAVAAPTAAPIDSGYVTTVRTIDRIANEEGVELTDSKAVEMVDIVVGTGEGKPSTDLIRKLVRLMK